MCEATCIQRVFNPARIKSLPLSWRTESKGGYNSLWSHLGWLPQDICAMLRTAMWSLLLATWDTSHDRSQVGLGKRSPHCELNAWPPIPATATFLFLSHWVMTDLISNIVVHRAIIPWISLIFNILCWFLPLVKAPTWDADIFTFCCFIQRFVYYTSSMFCRPALPRMFLPSPDHLAKWLTACLHESLS